MTTITLSSGTSRVIVSSGSTLIVDGGATSDDSVIAGAEIVSSGGLSLADVIESGGTASVFGSASATVIDSRGTQTLEAGAMGSATHIHGGGQLNVDAGAVVYAPVIYGGGGLLVSAGGVLMGGIAERNGGPDVFGSAVGTVIRSKGGMTIESGGVGSGIVDEGGTIRLHGSANNLNVEAGVVFESGSVDGLRFGGAKATGVDDILLYSGGSVINAKISAGGNGFIIQGGTLTSAVVSDGGYLLVSGHGSASDVTVDSGIVTVTGGSVVDVYIRSGGWLRLESPTDIADGLRISSGGNVGVYGGGATASGSYVLDGGAESVAIGGIISGTVVSSGGTLSFMSGTADDLVLRPGAEVVVSWTSASASIAGGMLEVLSGGVEVQSATLSGGGAGLGVTTKALGGGLTEITVTHAGHAMARPKAALFVQAHAAFGDGGALAGSSTVHGGGTTSAVAEMLKPR